MRSRTAVALALLLALGPAGCGRGNRQDPAVASARSGEPVAASSSSAPPARDPQAPLKFSQCMRAHGLPWFPDPDQQGRLKVDPPANLDHRKMDAARQACAAYAPDGGANDHKPTAAEIEQLRQVSKCMRENGVPNFPDPNPGGGISIDGDKLGTGPGNPTFDKAQQLCDKYAPKRNGDGSRQRTGSGGGR